VHISAELIASIVGGGKAVQIMSDPDTAKLVNGGKAGGGLKACRKDSGLSRILDP